jgi:hypothetical protein
VKTRLSTPLEESMRKVASPRLAARLAGCAAMGLLLAGCGEGDPFGAVTPNVREGSARIWEVSAEDLPSAFDLVTGQRLFLGSGDVGATLGDVFLDGAPGAVELRLRSVASLLRAEAAHAVEIRDLGEVDFEDVREVPEEGYTASEDSLGVTVAAGHVYALRLRRSELGFNFAKLVVDAVGSTGDDPDRQFIDFRFAVQIRPGDRHVVEED